MLRSEGPIDAAYCARASVETCPFCMLKFTLTGHEENGKEKKMIRKTRCSLYATSISLFSWSWKRCYSASQNFTMIGETAEHPFVNATPQLPSRPIPHDSPVTVAQPKRVMFHSQSLSTAVSLTYVYFTSRPSQVWRLFDAPCSIVRGAVRAVVSVHLKPHIRSLEIRDECNTHHRRTKH